MSSVIHDDHRESPLSEENAMNKLLAILLPVLLLTSNSAHAADIEGVAIPDSVTVADTTLQLNGAGIREKFFMDIYIGALYLPARTPDAAAILSDSGPASVLMHILHGKIDREKITGAWTEGMRTNLGSEEMQALQPTLDTFNRLFTTVHKGDIIRIDYNPAKGTEVRINDELRGTAGDNTFFRALLKVWLGPEPVSSSLKKAMLGFR
jgi:Chalcone isomerase-like